MARVHVPARMYAENFVLVRRCCNERERASERESKKMYDKNQFCIALWLPFILMTHKQKPLTPHSN